jgi:hypothetical protein
MQKRGEMLREKSETQAGNWWEIGGKETRNQREITAK